MCNICKQIWNVILLNKHFLNPATYPNQTNMKTLLRELDMRKSFRFTRSGGMIKMEHDDGD